VFPSSHSSIGARTRESPQIAGAPRVIVTSTNRPVSITVGTCSLPTIVPSVRPSTRTTIAVPPTMAGRRIAAVSWPLSRGRGESGKVPGANAATPEL
jgi:hypothetical protein